jgi:hypothetical protein
MFDINPLINHVITTEDKYYPQFMDQKTEA